MLHAQWRKRKWRRPHWNAQSTEESTLSKSSPLAQGKEVISLVKCNKRPISCLPLWAAVTLATSLNSRCNIKRWLYSFLVWFYLKIDLLSLCVCFFFFLSFSRLLIHHLESLHYNTVHMFMFRNSVLWKWLYAISWTSSLGCGATVPYFVSTSLFPFVKIPFDLPLVHVHWWRNVPTVCPTHKVEKLSWGGGS